LEITWYGLSCFRLTERNKISVVTDPFSDKIGLPPLKLKADVVTVSHDERGHNNLEAVKNEPRLINTPGEYELGGVFITGLAMHHIDGEIARANLAFSYQYDDLTVLHLGDLAHIPNQSTIESLGEIHVLLLPVGGGNSLRASQAAEVVALIEPHYVIPMHYAQPGLKLDLEPLEKFLKAMGASNVQEAESLKLNSSEAPDQPHLVVLQPQAQMV
jgi:L-ascorbate metabolism protein UlaG (beta-lactamase superfamily)